MHKLSRPEQWAALDGIEPPHPVPTILQEVSAFLIFRRARSLAQALQALHGHEGGQVLLGRTQAFQRGAWLQLLLQARVGRVSLPNCGAEDAADAERRRHVACAKIRHGKFLALAMV